MSRFSYVVPLLAFLCALAFPADGSAIVLKIKKTKTILRGKLVSETKSTLLVEVTEPGSKTAEKTFQLSDVDILYRVNRKRLALLRPGQAKTYLDQADEFAKRAEKYNDPEAKGLARRLYVIAAFGSSGAQKTKCLVALATVSQNSAEEKRIRALAYLSDPKRDPALLTSNPLANNAKKDLPWDDFREALRALRSGKVGEALDKVDEKGVAECFENVPGFFSIHEFRRLCLKMKCVCKGFGAIQCRTCKGKGIVNRRLCGDCSGNKRIVCGNCNGRGVAQQLELTQLRKIVRAELHLETKQSTKTTKRISSWATQVIADSAPVRELTLENVTQINPRKCVYRDGKWLEPPAP